MYKFWLDGVLLPVAPPKLDTKINGNNKTLFLINESEVSLIKPAGLTEFSFEVLIPQVKYPFAEYEDGNFISASVFVDKLEKLMVEQKPFSFKVERSLSSGVQLFGTDIKVTLEDYSIKEDANEGFDLIVSIQLKQYKEFGSVKLETVKDESGNIALTESTVRETSKSGEPKNTPKSYTVVKGDCLWNIAKRYYGDGAKYPVLVKANNISNPNFIKIGQVLTIPVQ